MSVGQREQASNRGSGIREQESKKITMNKLSSFMTNISGIAQITVT
jgi:hypothetical protein